MSRTWRACPRSRSRRSRAPLGIAGALALVFSGTACAPRARPLSGEAVPASRVPSARLEPGHHRVVFRWKFEDGTVTARGEGVARVAPPDSARLDFFLDGGLGGGYAIVLGDAISTPNDAQARRYLPPPSLLWAALGRLAVPASPDTTARVDGGVLRADIGHDPAWRATFDDAGRHRRLERLEGGRIREWVARELGTGGSGEVRYENAGAHRVLTLSIQRTLPDSEFDEAIWRR
jgi:hypothetical protein